MTNKLKPIHGIIVFLISFALLLTAGSYLQANFGIPGLVLSELIFVLVVIVSASVIRADLREVLPVKLPRIKSFFGGVMMYIGTYLLIIAVTLIMQYFFPEGISETSENINSWITGNSPFVGILVFALTPAICEEILMRGFILSSMKPIRSKALIVIIVGAMFGAMHFDLYRFLPTALLGAVFALIALETDSIVLPVLFHFINNSLSVVVSYNLSSLVTDVSQETGSAMLSVKYSLPTTIGMSLIYIAVAIPLVYFGYYLLSGKKVKMTAAAVSIVLTFALLIGGIITTVLTIARPVYIENIDEEVDTQFDREFTVEIEEDGNYMVQVVSTCAGGEASYKLKDSSGNILDEEPYSELLNKTSGVYLQKGTYSFTLSASEDLEDSEALLKAYVIVIKIGA